MRIVGRLLIVLAVLLPVGMLASGSSSSAVPSLGPPPVTGPAVLKCMHFKDDLRVSPGITDVPADQTVLGHGRLYGCNKAGGAARFSGTFHIPQADCTDLSMAGSGRFAWANGRSSTATLTLTSQVTEPNKVFIGGTIDTGMFSGLLVSAWVRFQPVFKGTGPSCSKSNPLKKISFTNSQSFQLLTPRPTSTTVTFHPTTSSEPTTTIRRATTTSRPAATTTSGPTTTVPITEAGSTAPPTTRSGGGGGHGRGGGTTVPGNHGGGLAFTGGNRVGALFGLESIVVGGALACLGGDGRARSARARKTRGPKFWLRVTLPPS